MFFTVDIRMVEAMEMQNIKCDANKLPMTMYLVNLDSETENIIFSSREHMYFVNSKIPREMIDKSHISKC